MRKKLENDEQHSLEQVETVAGECMEEVVELCSDYIGNTVIQKLFEHCSEQTKLKMLEKIAPFLASIGVHKNGTWAVKNRNTAPKQVPAATKTITKSFGKKGQQRTVVRPRAPSSYSLTAQRPAKKTVLKPVKLRASITPGTVLILLAGVHAGKRVVFLKQLPSGLLLVTGPYKLNGVPLRRVNQAYVIATSTKIDVSSVKVDAKFTDSYFQRKVEKKKKGEDQFFAQEATQKPAVAAEKVTDQKTFDKAVLEVVKKTPLLARYLSTPFSLKEGVAPHTLKF